MQLFLESQVGAAALCPVLPWWVRGPRSCAWSRRWVHAQCALLAPTCAHAQPVGRPCSCRWSRESAGVGLRCNVRDGADWVVLTAAAPAQCSCEESALRSASEHAPLFCCWCGQLASGLQVQPGCPPGRWPASRTTKLANSCLAFNPVCSARWRALRTTSLGALSSCRSTSGRGRTPSCSPSCGCGAALCLLRCACSLGRSRLPVVAGESRGCCAPALQAARAWPEDFHAMELPLCTASLPTCPPLCVTSLLPPLQRREEDKAKEQKEAARLARIRQRIQEERAAAEGGAAAEASEEEEI